MLHQQLNNLLEQIRNPSKRNWILMAPSSLGETVMVCGFAQSFVAKHGHGITLVIPESHGFIPECFPGTFDRVVYVPLITMRQFSESGFIPPNFFKVEFPINTWSNQSGDGRILALHELWIDTVGKAGLNFVDMYRYILRLEWDAKFTAPMVPEPAYRKADLLIKKHQIKKGKSVVFFIGNNTNKPSPAYLWEQIARRYIEQGYQIVINKHGSLFVPEGLSIPGAKMIDLPLELTIPISEHAGNVVSGSNGFVFFATAAKINCNMNILLPNEICYDYGNMLFKETNYLAGCHHLATPEFTNGITNFKEWIIPKTATHAALDEIAHGIVFNVLGENTITN